MKHGLALAGALTTLGAVALAPNAQAQDTVTIPFNGSVNALCTFSNVQAGTLAQSSLTGEFLMADDNSGVGQSGSVTIDCHGFPPAVRVSAPTLVQAPAGYNPDIVQAVITSGNESRMAGNGQFSNSFPWNATRTDYMMVSSGSSVPVSMVVGRNANSNGLPEGTYEYQVVVTAIWI